MGAMKLHTIEACFLCPAGCCCHIVFYEFHPLEGNLLNGRHHPAIRSMNSTWHGMDQGKVQLKRIHRS